MESTTTRKKQSAPAGKATEVKAGAADRARPSKSVAEHGPLSVPLPSDLRERLARQASARGLKMATAARVLLDERLRDLEDARELSQAEEWQRAQAWAVWDAIQAGDDRDVPMEEFQRVTEQALGRLAGGAQGTPSPRRPPRAR